MEEGTVVEGLASEDHSMDHSSCEAEEERHA